jgi:hypothetical protein
VPAVRLAVIATFHGRYENTLPLMHRLFVDGVHEPDEVWLMCEDEDDRDAMLDAFDELFELHLLDGIPTNAKIEILPTPRDEAGYKVIPYSYKINYALDHTECEAIAYLDNNSMPSPYKYALAVDALSHHPEWGAVYVTQKRTGFAPLVSVAETPIEDAFCNLNYTQVIHRLTEDRWSLDMQHADPDIADGLFWRALHKSLGSFHPVGGANVHDDHHIPKSKAVGV